MEKKTKGSLESQEDTRDQKKRYDRERTRKADRQPTAPEVFRGKHKDLQGWVYTYDTSARAYQYTKTTEALAEWVKMNLTFPMDVWRILITLKEPKKDEWKPEEPAKDAGKVEEKIFDGNVKKYLKRVSMFEDNCCNVFTVVYGQCSESLQAKLRGQEDWESIFEQNDLLKLMKSIKIWMLNQEGSRNPMAAADSSIMALFKVRQNRHESLTEYKRRFLAATEVLEHTGINFGRALVTLVDKSLKSMEGKTRKEADESAVTKAEERILEKFLAYRFIAAADKARFGNVVVYLENEYVAQSDKFPKDITAAYSFLENWKRSVTNVETPSNDGISFAQTGAPSGYTTGPKDRSHIQCFKCGKHGHKRHERKCDPDDVAKWQSKKNSENIPTHTVNYMTDVPNDSSDDSDDGFYHVTVCTVHEEVKDNEQSENEGRVIGADGEVVESVMTHSFNSKRAFVIPVGSVGLDSMSSVDVFGDRRLLTNIRTVPSKMRIICNAGEVLVTQMGNLGGYGPVWYHPGAIANILSLSNVQKRYKVRYDSTEGDFFTLERDDGTKRVFKPTRKGLYASQLLEGSEPKKELSKKEAALITTVDGNAKAFTKRELKRAKQARRLMAIIGRPSERQMREIVGQRQLINCDVNEQDVRNALKIFGPDIGSLKGKTTRTREPHIDLVARPIPSDIMKRHHEVVICFDVMYVNGIPFAVSISRALKFGTAEAIENRKSQTLLNSIKSIQATYARRGFLANRVAADNEFASLEGVLSSIGVSLNVVSRGEHVPEIERHIRTLKERCRAVYNTLPFRRIPNRMVVELVYAMNFWLHVFPAQDGVSATISPRELVTGVSIDANKHCIVPFGSYVQTHEEHDNSLATRTIGAIALRPTGNAQGGHFFYSLMSGQRIVRNNWTEIPAPADAIARVERMAGNKAMNRLTFGDRHNEEEHQEEDGEVISLPSDSDGSNSDTSSVVDSEQGEGSQEESGDEVDHADPPHQGGPTDNMERHERTTIEQENVRIKVEPTEDNSGHVNDEAGSDKEWRPENHEGGDSVSGEEDTKGPNLEHEDDAPITGEAAGGATPPNDDTGAAGVHRHRGAQRTEVRHNDSPQRTGVINIEGGVDSDGIKEREDYESGRALDAEMDARYGPRRRTGMRSRKKANYDIEACKAMAGNIIQDVHMLAQTDTEIIAPTFDVAQLTGLNSSYTPLLSTLLTQYGIKKGLRVFGKKADDAVNAEMRQLHELKVMKPTSPETLSAQDRQAALQYLMFVKQKRDGEIKGRGCADGRQQRQDAVKGEASSPTISTGAVFLILTIAAKERRDVMTMDIPGAFLQTELSGERVHVRFVGRMAELLSMIDPALYRPHIIMEKGRPVLYAQLQRALYGMLQSSLRFWEQVLRDLATLGFEVNPYDWCVANRMINGHQQTVGWHVDDFLVTHINPTANTELAEWFSDKYGKRTPVKVNRGKEHDYLGMYIDFSVTHKVQITMIDYIKEMLDESPSEFSGTAATPAARHLFDTGDEAPRLNEKRSAQFHHIVAKALFLAKRARPDIQLAVSFLCTRVRDCNEHDWKKLGRMLAYLRGTLDLALTLEADNGHVVKWWVDAAFAVTEDMRSQSGGAMTLGKGAIYSSSLRQRLNTRSSTEAELVAVNDFMPQVLWTRYFLLAQGYAVRDNLMFQDNQSAILLETNGKGSSGKRTRHINIRYFFVRDRVACGELAIKHCPAKDMVGDFFTKPLQGMDFRRFRDAVLNTVK